MTARSTQLPDRGGARSGAGRALLGTLAVLAAVAPAAALSGCASGSVASPPAGVDGLVVPTPSPDPRDFVTRVTNPWFPLEPGTRLVYDVLDTDGDHRLTVTVARGPVVAGVATTARVSTERGRSVTDWYAEDRAGDVWWFGRAGQWRAGVGGAEAGLAVPAVPRLGDGWTTAYVDGADLEVVTVVTRDAALTVPQGDHYPVLQLEVRTPATGEDRDVYYGKGAGLLEENTEEGPYRLVQLVEADGRG